MKQNPFLALALLAIGVMFFAANIIGAHWLAPVRVDATADRLYSLAPSTQATIAGLKQNIRLDFYAARDALSDDPALRIYSARVRDLLRAYATRSNGNITLNELDPAPFSTTEEAARGAGLRGITSADPDAPVLYLGLVVTGATDTKIVIPLFEPGNEARLEYEITRAILSATNQDRPRLAIVSSLPWLFSPPSSEAPPRPIAQIAQELSANYNLALLGPGFDQIPDDTKIILLAQPPELTPNQLYLLDQFALTKGRIFILLDPASSVAKDGSGGLSSATQSLGPLAQAWGFSVQSDVILDRAGALPVQTIIDGREIVAPQPLFFSIPHMGLNRSHAITQGLQQGLHVGTPGEVSATGNNGLRFEPLITTSPDTMRMDPVRALSGLTPDAIALEWETNQAPTTLGALISGQLRTAFPNGPPTSAPTILPHQTNSQSDAQILVIGDVDMLADTLYLNDQRPVADNGAFILNGLDVLSGRDDLVGLRSRAPSARPLVVIEAIKATAQARLLEEQQGLQSQLETASARLEALEARRAGAGLFQGQSQPALTPEQERELEQFRTQVQQTSRRLRAVQEGVAGSVGQIKTLLIFLTAILVPALVVLAGAIVFGVRRRADPKARHGLGLEPPTAQMGAEP